MITREEFESGVEFRDQHYSPYRYELIGDSGIITTYGNHLCNVSKITKTYFIFYKNILGHQIAKKVHFKNLEKL